MSEKQYYSALKTLEQLEHTLLPPVKGYIFSDLLSQQIPQLRQSIQDSSKAELTVSSLSICSLFLSLSLSLSPPLTLSYFPRLSLPPFPKPPPFLCTYTVL